MSKQGDIDGIADGGYVIGYTRRFDTGGAIHSAKAGIRERGGRITPAR